jgi:membrane fusion protein (multidrug efflux system)
MTSEPQAARPHPTHRLAAAGALVALAALLAACGDKSATAATGPGAGGGMPPPEVAVVTVQPGTVHLSTELPGRLEASRVAQVRARATGILLKRNFVEGSDVKAGQALYQIDAAPYDAALQSAQAQVAQAQAQLAQASSLAARYKPLVAAKAVSQQDYDAAVAAEKAAQAQVAAGQAAVRTARINLGYASVTAPISGRIGRSLVTEGALVSAQEATQLATIQQINPLYVNITQPAAQVLQLREALQAGQLERAGKTEAARVQVLLENGQPYGEAGRLLFTDLTVDPATGQVNLRAEVPNPRGLLLPGMYVRAPAAGRGGRRHPAAAAGRHARQRRRQRDGGGRRGQGGAAARQDSRRPRRRLDRHRRPEGGRAGDGRRRHEADDGRQGGQTRALAAQQGRGRRPSFASSFQISS